MGGLAPRMMPTTVTFLIGALGLAGRAAARRLLLEGRDPRARRSQRAPLRCCGRSLVVGALHDRLLHVPRSCSSPSSASPRMAKDVAHHIHESPAVMTVPLDRAGRPHGGGGPRRRHPVVARHARSSASSRRCCRGDEARAQRGHRVHACCVLSALVRARGRRARLDASTGARRCAPTAIGVPRNPLHALLLEQVLRRRDLRRALRAARSTGCSRWLRARLRRRRDRRRRQRRRRPWRWAGPGGAAPAADRLRA